MTLCNPKAWILEAQRGGYAIGAFNGNTLEQMQSVALAAAAENAPVIVQVSHRALQYLGSGSEILGLRYVAAMGVVAAQSVSVPVALHLDHANEDEVVQAVALGFTSVMFDGSLLSYEENVQVTRRLAKIAHAADVCIEAELGEVPKPGVSDSTEALTDPDEAKAFVEATGIDTLAVALGSVHAETEKHISIELERLNAIRQSVSVPLVLHGSSGVNDAEIAEGIRLGLSKINVATQLNVVFTQAVRDTVGKSVDPRKYLAPAREAMTEAVRERIRFFGAAGKA
jgi:fructose-bisphosphate aldolase class II